MFAVSNPIPPSELGLDSYVKRTFKWKSHIVDNNLYGLYYLYDSGKIDDSSVYIEHGLYLGIGVKNDVRIFPGIDKILTISEIRKRRLLNDGWEGDIIVMGNYIKYFNRIQYPTVGGVPIKDNGNVGLLFLPHAVKGVAKSVPESELYDKIKLLSSIHSLLLICVYVSFGIENLQLGQFSNVHLVTAGDRYDEFFMDRLSALISSSCMTYSFNVGTHVGYCYGLGVDHQIFSVEIEQKITSTDGNKEMLRINASKDAILVDTNIILSAFSVKGKTIEKDNVYKMFWE